jgi:two-component system phosphate regulon sensor histidine kinase PhoR
VKKSGFRVTVFVMSFALAGLIMLQAYWIFHDFKLKEQQFDQSVMLAMNEIVAKVEQQENIKIVVQNFMLITILSSEPKENFKKIPRNL